jgi:hypothetical protein
VIRRLLRLLGRRRRSSTKLTPAYSKRETSSLRKCHELFQAGRVGAHFNEGNPA